MDVGKTYELSETGELSAIAEEFGMLLVDNSLSAELLTVGVVRYDQEIGRRFSRQFLNQSPECHVGGFG